MNARLLSIAATSALAVGMIAAPVAAAGTTRYVDDDGTAAANGCNGALTVPTSIQAAIDASGPFDTIIVCKGSYPEALNIEGAGHKGLTLRGVSRWVAKVNPGTGDFGSIIRVASPRVTVQWLKVVAPTDVPCGDTSEGILVAGAAKATILSNIVLANPNGNTLSGPSVLIEGIDIDDGSTGAVVSHNIVRAFTAVGIMVHNADAKVINNSVQYWHQVSNTSSACRKAPGRTSPANPTTVTGIRSYQSTGVISLNAVTAAPDGQQASTYVYEAISTQGSDGLKIRRNYVTGGYSGIVLTDSDTAVIEGNVVVGTTAPQSSARTTPALVPSVGIQVISGTGSTVRENRVAHFFDGLLMEPGASGNTIDGNDATGNAFDCYEFTGTSAAGVHANAWGQTTPNLGNNDSPTGLCTDNAVTPIPGSPT